MLYNIYMNKIIYFKQNGKNIFVQWLLGLDVPVQARIRKVIKRMAAGNLGDCKIITPHLYETRLFFGSGYRIYYTIQNRTIVIILCGGDKKSQSKDISLAKKYLSLITGENYDQKR